MLRTHILSRNVEHVKRTLLWAATFLVVASCSRLPTLTPEVLQQAEEKWRTHKPISYHLVVEMSGDRVETGRFEIDVQNGQIVALRRNGLVVRTTVADDYTIEGLFRMLTQELAIAE